MTLAVFHAALLIAALLCGLVAGFLLAFAIVIMPGIGRLDDAAFLRTFRAVDRVIQRGQPLFVVMWAGSVVAVIAAAALGWWVAAGLERALVIAAAVVYQLGVQLPTGSINVPLNNQLQKLDVETMTEPAHRKARERFERRWNQWNAIRTVAAIFVTVLLLLVLLRV